VLAFVVDADSDHRISVGISLAFLGYEVFQFDDGAEAVAAARAVIPSLVIADVFTTDALGRGRDGVVLLSAIRKLHRRCRMVALLQSPAALADVIRATLGHLEIDATLVKPVVEAELTAIVQRFRETTIPLSGDVYARHQRRPLFLGK